MAEAFCNTPQPLWCSLSSLIRSPAGDDAPRVQHLRGRPQAFDHDPTCAVRATSYLRRFLPLENVRDTAYAEDASTGYTGDGPQVMATLRNIGISLLHLAGIT